MTSSTEFLTVSMPLRGKDTNTRPDADTATPTTCCSNSATICRSPTSRSTGRWEATGVTFSTLLLLSSPAKAEASRETDNTAHTFFIFFICLFVCLFVCLCSALRDDPHRLRRCLERRRAVPFDDGLLTIFSPDLSCTYLLDQFYYA